MMRKKWINLFVCSLIAVCSTAQTGGYKFYTQLDSVKASGFYTIELTPELNAHLKTDYSDLRIVNDSGRWVPHVMYSDKNNQFDVVFMDLKFVKTENDKSKTILLIENRFDIISNIGLTIRNTNAERFCTLSGSDDNINWFVINDSILINPSFDNTNTTNTFILNFPWSNYKYFKLIIYNNNKDPFDIKDVTTRTPPVLELYSLHESMQNPLSKIEQKDSAKISYIKIIQAQPYHFDHISFKLSGAKYFSRKADLYIPENSTHSFSRPGRLLQSFNLSNNSTLQFKVPLCNVSIFYLLINNEDNIPLTVNEVKTNNSYHSVTSYLEKGNNYKLILGNLSATAPNYDLVKLAKEMPGKILKPGKIIAIENNMPEVIPAKNNKWLLWAALIAALFILLLFTQKMIKEVNKRKQDDTI
jgi:hypothetical protein